MARPTFTTPHGAAVYPWLNKADSKFGDPTYKCNLAVETEAAQPLVDKLQDLFDAFYAEKLEEHGKKKMRCEDMPWDEDDNGNIVFKTKRNQFGKNKKTGEEWENKIRFFDASGKPVEKPPLIGGGSVLRLSIEPQCWEVSGKLGLKLNIKAVMIIEPKQGGSAATADSFGFEAEEGGYEYNPDTFEGAEGDEDGDY